MSTSFVAVAIQWADEDSPQYKIKIVDGELVAEPGGNLEWAKLQLAKAAEFVDAGKMVKGTLSIGRPWADPAKYPSHLPTRYFELGPILNDSTVIADPTTNTVESTAPGSMRKAVRLFVNEAAADEWINFVLSFGARLAVKLTEEELNTVLPGLPSDDVIRQFVTAQ